MKNTPSGRKKSIAFYDGGVETDGNHIIGNPSGKGGGKRSKIKGWSKASRRRMRKAMLTMRTPKTDVEIGATLTIPGPVLPVKDAKKLWQRFCRELERGGSSCIWRMEIQERGQLHFHIISGVDPAGIAGIGEVKASAHPAVNPPSCAHPVPYHDQKEWGDSDAAELWRRHYCKVYLAQLWDETLEWLGPRDFNPPHRTKGGATFTHVENLLELPGAEYFAVCVQTVDECKGAWLRYMQDHASKQKQGQIAEGFGRHWGIVGRRRYNVVFPERIVELSDAQYWRFLRAFQRLATPQRKAPAAPFGRRLGGRVRRGTWGKCPWFSRPGTVGRLVDWAAKTPEYKTAWELMETEKAQRGHKRPRMAFSP